MESTIMAGLSPSRDANGPIKKRKKKRNAAEKQDEV
jgi:hypothetical protein